jgi:hypothetical protein
MTSEPPVPLAIPPSWMTPLKNDPLVMVSVLPPRLTTPLPPGSNRAPTEAPDVVCEMSSVEPPGEMPAKPTNAELAIEPAPFSASVAPWSICVALL